MSGKKGTFLYGENIPRGVANAWDHSYLTSPTLLTLFKQFKQEKPAKKKKLQNLLLLS